jgi:nitroimidazol reductase NimA-like FMN-containing flavoprotein (pyridoxamine 5'-phosphate oxidase superfamily)
MIDESDGLHSHHQEPKTMATIPSELLHLFDEPALAHVSYLNRKGQIITFPMWIDFDGEHLLTSSPVGSRKGRAFRERPQVSLSMVSTSNRWHWLSVSGRVVDFRPDENLEFIDRMSHKYFGSDYPRRTPREIFTIEIDRVSPSAERIVRWTSDK